MTVDDVPARRVWRRQEGPATPDEPAAPKRCGGDLDETPEQERQRELRRRRERERLFAGEPPQKAAGGQRRPAARRPEPDDEDDVEAADRARNDRYAVRLLRQEQSAWGAP
ncbi:hypothetical protein Val02_72220 [Virgisporangium aliadipatigenens]|uniref:Uncharacterized protein n=1 Tax=Virgisporangium aliadipatigenens TaxID=741659 RepID=A0A8J4DUG7_9ACTN|nr:hypothetical protein [Virgisporangium aliadipatigenens]GIJ50336.1 hypothetical protein Val02_72220 [Virgisporangium aliadipatigenens]